MSFLYDCLKAVFVALHQLNIAEDVITAALIITFGAVSLALALAFGLGGKDLASEYLKNGLKKK